MSHTVYRMYFHLPNEQSVVFGEDNIEQVLNRAGEKDTMLTAWFKLNREDNYAKSLLYCEIPYSYVFNKLAREWRPRQRGSVYTRLHHIHPRNRELFLAIITGGTSLCFKSLQFFMRISNMLLILL